MADALPLRRLPLARCDAALADFGVPRAALECCLRTFGTRVDDDNDNDDVYAHSDDKVCRFKAAELFNKTDVRRPTAVVAAGGAS